MHSRELDMRLRIASFRAGEAIHFAPGCPDKDRRTLHRTNFEGDVPV
jgi:hypothetical protein